MSATTGTTLSPSRGDKPASPTAEVVHCLYYRRCRTEEWSEVFSSHDAEAVWLWFLEFRENGAFRFVERPAHLFDAIRRDGR